MFPAHRRPFYAGFGNRITVCPSCVCVCTRVRFTQLCVHTSVSFHILLVPTRHFPSHQDYLSYRAVGVPAGKVYIIDPSGEITLVRS